MAEQDSTLKENAVGDASTAYLVEAETTRTENVPAGYKRTEVGVIPEEWKTTKLGSLGGFFKGQGVKRAESDSGSIACVRYGEIYTHHDEIVRRFVSHISRTVADNATPLCTGDILFAGSGETKTEIGKAVAFVGEHEAYAGGDIVILRQKIANPRYLGYVLNAPVAVRQKSSKGQGDAVVHISASALASVKIPLPPLDEQRAIATALSDADALIASLERLIAKKRAIKQAAMQQLLTGQTRLPGFTGDWETKRLGEIGRFRGGSGFPTVFQGETAGQHPYFKVSDMNNVGNETFMESASNYISEATRKQLGAIAFPAKSIVFAKVGAAIFLERKKILSRSSCLDNNMAAFTLEDGAADCRFMHFVLLNMPLGNLVSTTALPSLNSKMLAGIECRLPSLTEQTAIAIVLSDMDAEIEALEHRRDKAHQIKQGMMQQLLTGWTRLIGAGGHGSELC